MQTLNFNCSFCGKLMAVGLNLLGRNVRCPHCKQVLQAPSTSGGVTPVPPPPAPQPQQEQPTIQLPAIESPESIFGEIHDEDLFGTRAPKVQMPAAVGSVAPQEPTVELQSRPLSPTPAPMPPPAPFEGTAQFDPPASFGPPAPAHVLEPPATATDTFPDFARPGSQWDSPISAVKSGKAPEPTPAENVTPEPVQPRNAPSSAASESGGGGGALVWILLAYSTLATAAVAYLFFTQTTESGHQSKEGGKHPYLAIPDLFGQFPPADRRKVSKIDGMPPPNLEVPKELQVPLGQTLAIGDLEIKPLKIEHREPKRFDIEAVTERSVEKQMSAILLLYLHLKNTSDVAEFCPTDPAFNSVPPKDSGATSYTGFVFGERLFLGGPFYWPDSQYQRQYISGQKDDDKRLGPKMEGDYVIASVKDAKGILEQIDKLKPDEPAIWRVQLRRGLYAWKDKEGQEHESSATCVVGVPFAKSDIQ